MSLEEEEEEFDPIDFLKSLDLEDFINCKTTNTILLENHQFQYDTILKQNIEYLYKKYNTAFRDKNLFGKDWDNEYAESFSNLLFNFISVKYDLNIFYENPDLASELIKLKE